MQEVGGNCRQNYKYKHGLILFSHSKNVLYMQKTALISSDTKCKNSLCEHPWNEASLYNEQHSTHLTFLCFIPAMMLASRHWPCGRLGELWVRTSQGTSWSSAMGKVPAVVVRWGGAWSRHLSVAMVTWCHIHLRALWHIIHHLWVMHSVALWVYMRHEQLRPWIHIPDRGRNQIYHIKPHTYLLYTSYMKYK